MKFDHEPQFKRERNPSLRPVVASYCLQRAGRRATHCAEHNDQLD